MKQSKISILKNSIYLILFSFIFISCEPEEVPVRDNQPSQQLDNILGETGDQAETTEDKKG